MFHETLTHAGGSSKGTAKESHALMLMRRALNRGYAVTATTGGGAEIRWGRIDRLTGNSVVRSIVLDPQLPAENLDARTRAQLAAINVGDARHVVTADRRYIDAGGTEIPTGETARLRARRLVAVDSKGRVRLTLVARLALLALDHTQVGGGTDGLAMCSCGFTVSAPAGEAADETLRFHRQAMTARFIESLPATYAAAIADTH
ncbi:hypothetical protein [Streptomyces sp. enrichment culture]|uniref:hypothetical protein n=1 Tax=Streptomyces sp. enrichment culture TaxID=1795815 RepID=UPI00347E48CE